MADLSRPEFIEIAGDKTVWPGGYLRCSSARLVRSWLRGDGYEPCYLPRGHEGEHDNLSDRGRMKWQQVPNAAADVQSPMSNFRALAASSAESAGSWPVGESS